MDATAQLNTALAGRYEIEREIGRGGMATVYLALDIKHQRKVALKVLNPELGAVLGVDRFLSEIRVTANLQHPNLLPLFDSGEADGLLFYVMPFVKGETLRDKLTHEKQLPIEEAVHITTAVAGALDYAHRHGVIHRDLKPENILLHDGQPLIADFGIALAVSNAGGARVTQTGLSLGTPQYMSPEQATSDRSIDGRTDIYSLGAVAYEMLSGEAPHIGNSAQAIIAKLMTEDPRPLTVLRRSVPANVDAAVRRALEKLPADRFATAKDFADALNSPLTPQSSGGAWGAPSAARGRFSQVLRALPWAIAALLAVALFVVWQRQNTQPAAVTARFKLDFDQAKRVEGDVPHPVAISPDGRTIAYVGRGPLGRLIFVRKIDELGARSLTGTEIANNVEFSRDGQTLSFLGENSILRRVPAAGGTVTAIVPTRITWGGISWGPHGDVVYSDVRSVWRVPSEGAAPILIARPDSAHGEFLFNPYVLPDGKNVIIANGSNAQEQYPFMVISIDGSKRRPLPIAGTNVVGYAQGVLAYGTSDGSIFGVPFDLGSQSTTGDPVKLVEGVDAKNNRGGVSAALSDNGTLIYLRGQSGAILSVLDKSGKSAVELPDRQVFQAPAWSPDGTRIAVGSGGSLGGAGGAMGTRGAIWIFDVRSRVFSRLTSQQSGFRPSWMADGKRIAFMNASAGRLTRVLSIPADGSDTAQVLFEMPGVDLREVVFSPDGRYAVVRSDAGPNGKTQRDLWLVPLTGPRKAVPLAQGPSNELLPSISPDSKWVAYQSDQTGQYEIYVRPLSPVGGLIQISSGGGTEPRWMPDGRHVVYRSGAAFRSVALSTATGSPVVQGRDSLFADPFEKYDMSRQNYDISRDGKFVVVRDAAEGADVVVVVNWLTEARAKLKSR
jgi:tRNA A-37 threonylcarbamoyl transferase component Bud32